MVADTPNHIENTGAVVDRTEPAWLTPKPEANPDLARMDLLDSRVNLGFPMAPSVENEYRALISSHEQPQQSEADRSIALEGRVRMLQHYMAAGDSVKVLQMAIETAQLYPNALDDSRFSSLAANSFLQLNPTFRGILLNAPEGQQDMFKHFAMPTSRDLEWSQKATQMMKEYDEKLGDPETRAEGLQDYREFIANSEFMKPQDRGDRKMGGEARIRLIQHLQNGGADNTEILQLMIETMTKYPELAAGKRFVAVAQELDAGSNAAWLKAYITAGGDPALVKHHPKTP